MLNATFRVAANVFMLMIQQQLTKFNAKLVWPKDITCKTIPALSAHLIVTTAIPLMECAVFARRVTIFILTHINA